MTAPPLDLVIKNVRVVRPRQPAVEILDLGVQGRPLRADRARHPRRRRPDGLRRPRPPRLPGRRGRPHARGHLRAARRATRMTREQGGGLGRRDRDADLLPHRPVLSQPRRRLPRLLPRGAAALRGPLLVDYAYHLAPDRSAPTSTRWRRWRSSTACRRSRSSCSTAATASTARPTAATSGTSSCSAEDESYDLAHFEFVMRGAARLSSAHPELRDHVSVSLHCELADILNAYTRHRPAGPVPDRAPRLQRRPPAALGRASAVWIAAYLAHEAELPEHQPAPPLVPQGDGGGLTMRAAFPHIDFRREVTVGHLLARLRRARGALGQGQPADPAARRRRVPLAGRARRRGRLDRERPRLLRHGDEARRGASRRLWLAKAGFGGTEYLLSGRVQRGSKRGLSLARMAELLSWNPARRFGLGGKGDIAAGYDADLACSTRADLHRARRRLALGPGLHALRGAGAARAR